MVMAGFDGREPTEAVRALIRDRKLGGVIYFRRNAGTAEEVARLSAALRELAAEATKAPLWIAVDQEGGMVARLDRGVTVMPGQMALGAARSAKWARKAARASGAQLARLGINLNFAPSLDVNNNPANPVIGVRSFGERPELAAELGVAAIRGYREAGVVACAKHFPGHGDTVADSHRELPAVPHDRKRLEAVELLPFRLAVAAGAEAIMTAHVRFPALEPDGLPATLSPRILRGLLREEWGFDGVVFTDCLEMKAISGTVGVARGAVMAVKAGADVVLVSHTPKLQKAALDALYDAVVDGEIPEERIDESVRRIVALKTAYATDPAGRGDVMSGREISGLADDAAALAREICRHAVTLVRNEHGALPLRRDLPTIVVWPEVRQGTEVDEAVVRELTLGRALAPHLGEVKEWMIGTVPDEAEIRHTLAEIDKALKEIRGRHPSAESGDGRACLQVVVGTYNASFAPGQAELVRRLLDLEGVKVTVAALRDPYDLLAFPDVHAFVACYENTPRMMETAAEVLAGKERARGRLPVTLSERYPFGYGMTGIPEEADRVSDKSAGR
ncbi:MAG: glycoside hydrolase [Paenibacillaceae bacterium ZCTH02-B3]|nr:MAG: glycoside hydrolase [Paenibacillaceae bacterium ZCTH02-B3]